MGECEEDLALPAAVGDVLSRNSQFLATPSSSLRCSLDSSFFEEAEFVLSTLGMYALFSSLSFGALWTLGSVKFVRRERDESS